MATTTIIELIDDVTGEPAEETLTFALDGTVYEIDLTIANADKLRADFATYLTHGRRIRAARAGLHPVERREHRESPDGQFSKADRDAMRRWGPRNGFAISRAGRIPLELQSRWVKAGRPD